MRKFLAWLKKWFSCERSYELEITQKTKDEALAEISKTQDAIRKFMDC